MSRPNGARLALAAALILDFAVLTSVTDWPWWWLLAPPAAMFLIVIGGVAAAAIVREIVHD